MIGKAGYESGGSGGAGLRRDPSVLPAIIVTVIGLVSDKLSEVDLTVLTRHWPLLIIGLGMALLLQTCENKKDGVR